MIIYIVQSLLVFVFMWVNKKKKSTWFSASGFLVFVYALASLAAIPTLTIGEYVEARNSSYWLPMLEFIFCLGIFIVPFCRFNEQSVCKIELPEMAVLNTFSNFVICLSFFSIAFFSSSVSNIFLLGNLGDARGELYSGELFVETGLLNTIASVGASLYVFAILLFFVYSIMGYHKKRCILLLISSVSEPLHILSYVGRDGVVFWLFSFIFLFLFFRPFMHEELKKNIKKSFVIGAIILLIPFLAISISRFGSNDSGTISALISYMGQSFIGGPLYMGIEDKPFNEGASFPLFYEITGLKQSSAYEMGGGMLQIGEWRAWGFSTFVISLYRSMHFVGLLVLALFSLFVQYKTLGKEKYLFSFECLFIYLLFFQIFSQGVFYFKQYTRGGNLFIVLCLLLYIVFKNMPKSNIVIEKQYSD